MTKVEAAVLFPIPDPLLYSKKKLLESFKSILLQSDLPDEIILINCCSDKLIANELEQMAKTSGIPCQIHTNKDFNQNLASAISQIKTRYFLFIQNETAPVFLRKSTLAQFKWSAERRPNAGLIYGDYDVILPNGDQKEQHLLPFHEGRVRDNMDFGRVFFISKEVFENTDGLSQKYKHGFLYDLRLKISSQAELVLISNRTNGSLYTVEEMAKEHNVFDYLLSGKEIQLEMEQIVTDHLKRIHAYLPPGEFYKIVEYTSAEELEFQNCIASVIIPVNNRPEFIGTAIESVQQQSVRNVEIIIVVNGGEQDPTIEVVKSYQSGGENFNPDLQPVRQIVHDINNIGLCLNSGLNAAKGKYYVQLDSDDRLKPDAIEKMIEVFDSDPHIGMVIGSYEVWQKEDDDRFFRREDIPVVTHDEWTEENGRNNLLRINGAGAPRAAHIKVLKEMGWFSVNDIPYSRNYGEDYEMVLKISENYRIGRVWTPIYEVIRHSGGTDHSIDQDTVDRNDNAKDWMRLEAIRRRRRINRED